MKNLFKSPTSIIRGLLAGYRITKGEACKKLEVSPVTFEKKLRDPGLLTLEDLKHLAILFLLKEKNNDTLTLCSIELEEEEVQERVVELTANITSKLKF